jgi:hypothetical protein
MNFSPHSRFRSSKSFRRTLLRRLLHTFGAVAPVTHSNGITYRRNYPKTRKSFRRLLLPLFIPVSPLGAHSYEKMGGAPSLPVDRWHVNNGSGPNYLCSLSLTRFHQNASKIALCFLSLTDIHSRNYQCSLSLTKKAGWGPPLRSLGEGGVGYVAPPFRVASSAFWFSGGCKGQLGIAATLKGWRYTIKVPSVMRAADERDNVRAPNKT